MKKLNLIVGITAIIFTQTNGHAQGLYIGAGGGYGFPSALQSFRDVAPNGSENYTDNYNANTGGTTTTTTTNNISKSFSMGSTGIIDVYGGYMLTKNIGFELGIVDKLSSTATSGFTSSENYVETGGLELAGSETWIDTYTFTCGSAMQINPAIRLMTGNGQIHPYMTTGLIIGFAPATTLEDQTIYTTSNTVAFNTIPYSEDLIYTFSGGMMIGFHASVGALYMFSDNIGVSAEIYGSFMNWSPKKALITTLTYNGADSSANSHFLSERGINTETDYVSSASTTTTNGANPSPLTPQQHTLVYIPFSSYGIKISLHYDFGGGSNTKLPANP